MNSETEYLPDDTLSLLNQAMFSNPEASYPLKEQAMAISTEYAAYGVIGYSKTGLFTFPIPNT